jgi:predicted enzyme related to lactoylglutathione lyase
MHGVDYFEPCQHKARSTRVDVVARSRLKVAVTRIIANLTAPDPMALARFYKEAFGLDLTFDMGWIAFLSKDTTQKVELHTASEGGSGTELPVISIGVDDLDAAETAVRAAGAEVVYGPVKEGWGLRRFFFRDPAGNLVNVVDH